MICDEICIRSGGINGEKCHKIANFAVLKTQELLELTMRTYGARRDSIFPKTIVINTQLTYKKVKSIVGSKGFIPLAGFWAELQKNFACCESDFCALKRMPAVMRQFFCAYGYAIAQKSPAYGCAIAGCKKKRVSVRNALKTEDVVSV